MTGCEYQHICGDKKVPLGITPYMYSTYCCNGHHEKCPAFFEAKRIFQMKVGEITEFFSELNRELSKLDFERVLKNRIGVGSLTAIKSILKQELSNVLK